MFFDFDTGPDPPTHPRRRILWPNPTEPDPTRPNLTHGWARPMSVSTCPFDRSFICYQTSERDMLKMNEPILMQIRTSGPQSNGIKRSTLGVRKSKVKVAWG